MHPSPPCNASPVRPRLRRCIKMYSWVWPKFTRFSSRCLSLSQTLKTHKYTCLAMQKFVRPVEEMYKFHVWNSRPLDIGFFKAKPMVLLIGGYSVGKTSFIKYLLGRLFHPYYRQTMRKIPHPRIHAGTPTTHTRSPPPSRDFLGGRIGPEPVTDR